ncbi:uncharacterized protein N7511_007276 [Penicillium nucicola]|uniref:uncharacterized protein n=1 Tax=Penicillium nucicola TaxID=1850975 RepID=UPI002545B954|nr:uncharacterized protein N7511_007276 [Penicillium nucicola]KAJ5757094.1 hypothetical protein N7511_007276 [Penicillium nucicola]
MDLSYENLGLEARSNSLSGPRSRVIKQDPNAEREEKPRKQRKRALVACTRCRKRKIKCNGDLNNGLACSSCRSVGSTECQYMRVHSDTPEEIKKRLAGLPPTSSARYRVYTGHTPERQAQIWMDSQSRHPYQDYDMAMDGNVHYDEQSNYYPQYMLPSTGNMTGNMIDYGTWGTRTCDPMLTSRQSNGDLFEGTSLSQSQAQAGYGFNMSQGIPSDPNQSSGVNQSFSDMERTLPTPPTCRSQPQPQGQPQAPVTTLSTLPEGLSGMSLATDPKNPFWNSHARGMAMPIVPSNGYTSPRVKVNTSETATPTPDLAFGYMPMATTEDTSPPLPPAASSISSFATGNSTLYPVLDTIDEYRNDPDHRLTYNAFSRDKSSNSRSNSLMPDCSPYSYGYRSSERSKARDSASANETRCSAPTLMNGLPYSRVRHPEHNLALPFDLLADPFPEYGRVESVTRHPISPLGHRAAY